MPPEVFKNRINLIGSQEILISLRGREIPRAGLYQGMFLVMNILEMRF
jgi:hypothetical protein